MSCNTSENRMFNTSAINAGIGDPLSFTRSRSKQVGLISIYAALVLVCSYLLAYIPNVEVTTCLLFVAGYCFGTKHGCLVAFVVSVIFCYFNPFGPSPIFMLAFQISFYTLCGFLGGILFHFKHEKKFQLTLKTSLQLGILGLFLTIYFDVVITIVMNLPYFGLNWTAIWTSWLFGSVFSIIHYISNTLIFAFVLPVITNSILTHYGFQFRG